MRFEYMMKAHQTKYSGVEFRSRLEARWAAFFDLAGWKWEYEPIDLHGWTPDFRVKFECGHSECGHINGWHTLLVEIKPFDDIRQFDGHQCMRYLEGYDNETPGHVAPQGLGFCSSAGFGNSPDVTYWSMSHGSGGGDECVEKWIPNWRRLWNEAGNITRYKK